MPKAEDLTIALCDGHGLNTKGKETPYIPELGRKVKENEFNSAVVKLLDVELKRCGFKTLLVAPTDYDTPLSERVKLANSKGADAYVSIHFDAFDGKFDGNDPEGHSIFVYPGAKDSRKLAECIHKHLRGGTAQKDRGIKEANFYVLRETKMTAILSENGFMDNKREAMLMLDPNFQKEVAVEHAKGICDYFGVKYVEEGKSTSSAPSKSTTSKSESATSSAKTFSFKKPSRTLKKGMNGSDVKHVQQALLFLGYKLPKYGADGDYGNETISAIKQFQKSAGITQDGIAGNNTYSKLADAINKKNSQITKTATTSNKLYRVQTGAFSVKANADALLVRLKQKGYNPFVTKEGKFYKVQVGAFSNRSNADKLVKDLKSKSFDAIIV